MYTSDRNNVYDKWKKLHKLKFNTFVTYRKYEKTQILMSNLSTETQFCTSSNNIDDSLDAEYLLNNKLIEISNFNQLLDSAIKILIKAKTNNISIDYSSYFFIGQKNQNKITDLEIFIGDLDYISIFYTTDVIDQLETSIKKFIINFVEKESRPKYLSILESKFKDLKL